MKILISIYHITDTEHPHFFKRAHLDAVRKTAGKKAKIVVTADRKEAASHIADADVLAGFPFTIPPLSGAKKLKWLHSFSAGVDRILTPETKRLPILISNSSGIHATPIAEHLIGFILIFTRRFHRILRNQLRREWKRDETITELRGKTVLVVGLGDIGMETARLARAFGARVIAVSRTGKAKPPFVDELKTGRGLDALLPKADFVAICLPHTKETHHLFDRNKFKKMKRTAVVMNIGRGGIVDEKDLIRALEQKIIGGAALDVTEEEPLPKTSPLWNMENVVITPHHSGLSEKYMDRAIELFRRNLRAYLKGKRLLTLVNKELEY